MPVFKKIWLDLGLTVRSFKYLVLTTDMMFYIDNSIFVITINWRFVVWPIIEEYRKVYESFSPTCKVQKWL